MSASSVKHSFRHQSLEAPQEPESPTEVSRQSTSQALSPHTPQTHTHTHTSQRIHARGTDSPQNSRVCADSAPPHPDPQPPLSRGSEGLLCFHRSCCVGTTNINTDMVPGGGVRADRGGVCAGQNAAKQSLQNCRV